MGPHTPSDDPLDRYYGASLREDTMTLAKKIDKVLEVLACLKTTHYLTSPDLDPSIVFQIEHEYTWVVHEGNKSV